MRMKAALRRKLDRRGLTAIETAIIAVVFIAIAAGIGMWLYSMYSSATAGQQDFTYRVELYSTHGYLWVKNMGTTDIVKVEAKMVDASDETKVYLQTAEKITRLDNNQPVSPQYPIRPGEEIQLKIGWDNNPDVGTEVSMTIKVTFAGGKVVEKVGTAYVRAA